MFFCSLGTQWNWISGFSLSRRSGLNYAAVESSMRMNRMKDRQGMLERLQIMEAAALDVWNKQSPA